jgi:hypothetical protein
MRRGADRRTGAGDDMAPRIARAGDEAQPIGGGSERRYRLPGQPYHDQRAAWGRPHTAGARRLSRQDEPMQRSCIRMPESEPCAQCECTIPQSMGADNLGRDGARLA